MRLIDFLLIENLPLPLLEVHADLVHRWVGGVAGGGTFGGRAAKCQKPKICPSGSLPDYGLKVRTARDLPAYILGLYRGH